jgi:hypothetical protein
MSNFEISVFMSLLGITIILLGILLELNRLRIYAYSLPMMKAVPEHKQNKSHASRIKDGGLLPRKSVVSGARIRVGEDHAEYRKRYEDEDNYR